MEIENHLYGVVYEMNFDLVTYKRTVYSFLEWVSELGGLASALFALFSIVSKIFQYQAIDFYMVQELYKRSQLDED